MRVKKSVFVKFFFILAIAVFAWILIENDGFEPSKIAFDQPSCSIDVSSEDVSLAQEILSQKFHYLSSGRQCFVFESEDKDYVIKFLNKRNFIYSKILNKFSFVPKIKKIIQRKERKHLLTFLSMKLAYENLREETKIVYINLNENILLRQKIKAVNKCKAPFEIDVDKTVFILQKKVTPFFSYLKNTDDNEKIKKAIDSYFNLVLSRCKKNIGDDDFNIIDNIGFYQGKAVIMDIGKLYFSESLDKKDEILLSTKLLKQWLSQNKPELIPFFEEKLKMHL